MPGWKSSSHSSSLIPRRWNGALYQLRRISFSSGNAMWSQEHSDSSDSLHTACNTHCSPVDVFWPEAPNPERSLGVSKVLTDKEVPPNPCRNCNRTCGSLCPFKPPCMGRGGPCSMGAQHGLQAGLCSPDRGPDRTPLTAASSRVNQNNVSLKWAQEEVRWQVSQCLGSPRAPMYMQLQFWRHDGNSGYKETWVITKSWLTAQEYLVISIVN